MEKSKKHLEDEVQNAVSKITKEPKAVEKPAPAKAAEKPAKAPEKKKAPAAKKEEAVKEEDKDDFKPQKVEDASPNLKLEVDKK